MAYPENASVLDQAGSRLATELSHTSIPLLLLSPEGRIRANNPAVDRLFGYAQGTLVGRSVLDLLEPEVAPALDAALRDHSGRTGMSVGFSRSVPGRRRDGSRFPLDIALCDLKVLDADGLLAVACDRETLRVPARELSDREELFSTALEAAQLGVWQRDLDTDEMIWGGHFEEILIPSPGGFDGTYEGMLRVIHPADRGPLQDQMERAQRKRASYSHEVRVFRPDGQVRFVHIWGRFHMDERGDPVRSIGAFRDITERQVLEQQLVQAQKIEAIGQLAAGIAHEINTPTQYVSDNLRFIRDAVSDIRSLLEAHQRLVDELSAAGIEPEKIAAIRALAVSIDHDYLIDEVPKAMQQALDGIGRVSEIVRAVKSFSHPGSSERGLADLNEIVRNTLTVSRNEWKYVADVDAVLDEKLPSIVCLRSEIQQVLLNLVVNAAHAIGDANKNRETNKGTIGVRTRLDGREVELSISDTGIGIPKHIQSKIFNPFFTTKEVGKGTGQGLAMVHDIVVKKHGGSVRFETEVGQGTTFIVRMPVGHGEST